MDADRARRWVPLAVVGVLLTAAAVAASAATPGIRRVPIRHASQPPPSAPPSAPVNSVVPPSGGAGAGPHGAIPSWIGTAISLIGVALLVALVGVLIWQGLRYILHTRAEQVIAADAGRAPEPTRRAAVLAAVDAGLAELADADGDPRAAVIACWVRLEQVAAAAGTPRGPADTPSDLVTRLLGAHQVSAGALASLADLYRAARYGIGPVDDDMRTRARSALARLRDELAYSRSGPLAADAVSGGGGPRHARPEDDR